MYWPSPTLRWITVPGIGAATIDSAPMRSSFSSLAISSSDAAQDAQPVARGGEENFGRPQVALRAPRSDWACSRSFGAPPRIASSSRWRFSLAWARASLRPRLARARRPRSPGRSGPGRTRSPRSRTGGPRARRHRPAGDQAGDPAGVGREHGGGGVLVDRDLAVGRALLAESDGHGGEPQGSPIAFRSAGTSRRFGAGPPGAPRALPGPVFIAQCSRRRRRRRHNSDGDQGRFRLEARGRGGPGWGVFIRESAEPYAGGLKEPQVS